MSKIFGRNCRGAWAILILQAVMLVTGVAGASDGAMGEIDTQGIEKALISMSPFFQMMGLVALVCGLGITFASGELRYLVQAMFCAGIFFFAPTLLQSLAVKAPEGGIQSSDVVAAPSSTSSDAAAQIASPEAGGATNDVPAALMAGAEGQGAQTTETGPSPAGEPVLKVSEASAKRSSAPVAENPCAGLKGLQYLPNQHGEAVIHDCG